jgi:predicted DNA binding CopG/RHH family protein
MSAPTETESKLERLQGRISSASLARVKAAHAKTYEQHGLAFSTWIVAVLLAKADRTLGKEKK